MAKNLIQIQAGSKSMGGKTLFEDITFAINEKEHIGVIGANGAGKSTLFKIIVGELDLDRGEKIFSRSLRLGYLAQDDGWGTSETVEAYVGHEALLPIWELKKLAAGFGLTEEQLVQPVNSLSGGYRMRCKLLKLIGQESNILLLDEPTNYLDLESLLVLENFLIEFQGAFLLISHDREFLRRVTDHVLEIELGDVAKFPGNLDDYFEQKAQLAEQMKKTAMSQENKRNEILKFATRFGAKATKAKQAQSKLKQLSKMEPIEVKTLPTRARISIPPPIRTGRHVLDMEKVDLGYNQAPVLSDVSLSLERGDHVAVVGVNGAGKSTLIKGLAQVLRPMKGEVKQGHNVTLGYYAQHVSEALEATETVFEALQREAHPEIHHQQILDLAGSFLFSGEEIKKKIRVLSGGEKARVALAQILLRKCSCLLLDEPTNHLDFETVEALTQALAAYPGTLVVVSHDRSFIRRVGKKIYEIDYGQLRVYPGTYDEYVWSQQKGILSQEKISNEGQISLSTVQKSSKPNFKEEKKRLQKKFRDLDRASKKIEQEMRQMDQKISDLNDELLLVQGASAEELARELSELQTQLEKREREWVEIEESLEQIKCQI